MVLVLTHLLPRCFSITCPHSSREPSFAKPRAGPFLRPGTPPLASTQLTNTEGGWEAGQKCFPPPELLCEFSRPVWWEDVSSTQFFPLTSRFFPQVPEAELARKPLVPPGEDIYQMGGDVLLPSGILFLQITPQRRNKVPEIKRIPTEEKNWQTRDDIMRPQNEIEALAEWFFSFTGACWSVSGQLQLDWRLGFIRLMYVENLRTIFRNCFAFWLYLHTTSFFPKTFPALCFTSRPLFVVLKLGMKNHILKKCALYIFQVHCFF